MSGIADFERRKDDHDYGESLRAAFDAMHKARFEDGITDSETVANIGALAGQMHAEARAELRALIESRNTSLTLARDCLARGDLALAAEGAAVIEEADNEIRVKLAQLGEAS